jgi:hypothetical protein
MDLTPTDYLRQKEWSAGNGQCPECWGVPPDWLGPGHPPQSIGHEKDCPLGKAIESLGGAVIFKGSYYPEAIVLEEYQKRLADPGEPWVSWQKRLDELMLEAYRKAGEAK